MSSSTDKDPCNCEQSLALMRELEAIKDDMKVLADSSGRAEYHCNSKKKEIRNIANKYR